MYIRTCRCSGKGNVTVQNNITYMENRYANFDKLNSIDKTVYVLGSELWEYDFALLSFVQEYVLSVWDAHKQKLYSDDTCSSQLQSLAEDLQLGGVEGQTDGKLCPSGEGGMSSTAPRGNPSNPDYTLRPSPGPSLCPYLGEFPVAITSTYTKGCGSTGH